MYFKYLFRCPTTDRRQAVGVASSNLFMLLNTQEPTRAGAVKIEAKLFIFYYVPASVALARLAKGALNT